MKNLISMLKITVICSGVSIIPMPFVNTILYIIVARIFHTCYISVNYNYILYIVFKNYIYVKVCSVAVTERAYYVQTVHSAHC